MPRIPVFVFLFLLMALPTADLSAQNGADQRQEYIRSSSPTKRGGKVYSETVGNGRTQYRFDTPSRDQAARPESAADQDRDSDSRFAEPRVAYRQSAADLRPTLQNQNNANPYGYGYGCCAPANRVAQCNCGQLPAPPTQLQYQGQAAYGQVPVNYQQAPQGFPGYAAQPQSGLFQGGLFQGGLFGRGQNTQAGGYPLQSGIGVPQFNQTGGSWWSPFITGSGYYTPLLSFRNMPQGTYLGQGLIGQPTAYVDGQPFRNLLRYVSP